MTRLEALEKVAEAARLALPPEAYYPKNEGTAVHSLAKSLEELDKVPRIRKNWLEYHACFTGDCPHDDVQACIDELKKSAAEFDIATEHRDPAVLVQALKVYGSIYNWRVASQKNSERAGFEFMADDQAGYLAREALRQWESQK